MMHGRAHEPLGSVIVILGLKLHRYGRIVNQALMLPNTSLVPTQHDERCSRSKYLRHSRASGHGDGPMRDGTARMDIWLSIS